MVVIELLENMFHELTMDMKASLIDAIPQIILHFGEME